MCNIEEHEVRRKQTSNLGGALEIENGKRDSNVLVKVRFLLYIWNSKWKTRFQCFSEHTHTHTHMYVCLYVYMLDSSMGLCMYDFIINCGFYFPSFHFIFFLFFLQSEEAPIIPDNVR